MHRAIRLALCAWVILSAAQSVAQHKLAAARVASIAPLLNANTFAIIHLNLERIRGKDLFKKYGEELASKTTPADQMAASQAAVLRNLELLPQTGATDIYLIVFDTWARGPEPTSGAGKPDAGAPGGAVSAFVVIPFRTGSNPQEIVDLLSPGGQPNPPFVFVFQQFVVAGAPGLESWLKDFKPTPCPHFVPAFKAAGDTDLQIVVAPTPASRKMQMGFPPAVPKHFADQLVSLQQNTDWAVITANFPARPAFALIVQFKDVASATKIQDTIVQGLVPVKQALASAAPDVDNLISVLTPKLRDSQLRVVLTEANGGIAQMSKYYQMMMTSIPSPARPGAPP